MDKLLSRRRFLSGAASLGAFALAPVALAAEEKGPAEDVAPAEDLMREHGALNRILLIYDRFAGTLGAGSDDHLPVLHDSADLLKRFIEGYHEKLEEEHLFPRFSKTPLAALAATLKAQHAAGRRLTASVLSLSKARALDDARRRELAGALGSFVRMYRPHEAREDTVLFPAFKTLVTRREYEDLGERFEDKEHELFGKAGFGGVVARIGELEKAVGLFDLAQFTP